VAVQRDPPTPYVERLDGKAAGGEVAVMTTLVGEEVGEAGRETSRRAATSLQLSHPTRSRISRPAWSSSTTVLHPCWEPDTGEMGIQRTLEECRAAA
jgi:hypothetical protein